MRQVSRMNENSSTPKFSIIIPAYNAEKFIDIAINSVKNQTLNDWELIIVENGSIDNTSASCEKHLNDKRVKLTHSEKGVSNARNTGIDLAKGRWLVFLDADDQLLTDTLQKYSEIDDEFSPDLIVGEYVNEKQSYNGKSVLYHNDSLKDFLKISLENPTQKCNTKAVAFKNTLVQYHGIRFDKTIRYAEDSVFFLEMLVHSEKVAMLNYPVYRVVYYSQSAVRSGTRKLDKEYLPAINKIKTILDLSDSFIQNEMYLFILNQLLVIMVNDLFARQESSFAQIKDAIAVMKIPEYNNAIKHVDLSEINGMKKIVFRMMKMHLMPAILLASRIRQRQNKKKENMFYV